jgi:hypothetical protein
MLVNFILDLLTLASGLGALSGGRPLLELVEHHFADGRTLYRSG